MNESRIIRVLAALMILALAASPQRADQAVSFTPGEIKRIVQHELGPVPADPTNRYADDPAAAHLGQFLFFEKRFSSNGEVSCATCHDSASEFADGAPTATGLMPLTRHTQSLWNVAYNRWFFWDGRADTLWAQALDPMENEREFGGNRLRIAHTIASDPELRKAYTLVFGEFPQLDDRARFPLDGKPTQNEPDGWESMSAEDQRTVNEILVNLGKAIAAYERKLISRNSAFDRFLAGLKSGDDALRAELSPAAQRGLKLFVGQANCRLCHAGPNFTDGEFHNNGVPGDQAGAGDSGRFDGIAKVMASAFNAHGDFCDEPAGPCAQKTRSLVKSSEAWGQFKTPGLRNVGKTAPYMHQGQFASLGEVLKFYSTLEGQVLVGHHQETLLKPVGLTPGELQDLEAFLNSLTGDPISPDLLRQPDSPIAALNNAAQK